jgi:hypothetical protein
VEIMAFGKAGGSEERGKGEVDTELVHERRE